MWKCPSCHCQLSQVSSGWKCENGHSFDRAKEGYVNLLLAHQKRSKEPGDNREMIDARREFLQQGHYQPMALNVASLIQTHLHKEALSVFDAGCGEGYYLNFIRQQFLDDGLKVISAGCDIAKVGVQRAAKKYKECQFSVASTFAIPLMDISQDAVVQVFAPASEDEVRRVLNTGGLWISVNPAENHLQQLKAAIYQQVEQHQVTQNCPDGFSLLKDKRLTFTFDLLDENSRLQLLKMTPYYWSATKEKIETLVSSLIELTADFHIRVLEKQ